MTRRRLAYLALIAVAGLLAACGAKTEDLRYRDARELSALQVPPDLDRPREAAQMKIPQQPPEAKPGPTPDSAAVTADGDMGRPPNLLSGQ